MQDNTPEHDTEDDFDGPSKSQLKRDSTALQKLGDDLLALPESRWEPLSLPEILYDALKAAKKITNFEGKRRQMQYIGKLMRRVDPEPIREAVAAFKLGHAQDSLKLHQSERWRERLLASDDALQEFLAEHQGVDIQQVRNLVRAARKDAANEPEKRSGRAYRELFQFIKASEAHAAADDAPADE
ncbi:ribosome biogenesis factor YjgA [Roseateles sp. DC23W]|uniref:Dual-action ribosomal maturation protein DarP n=1 Tax=Pelomonas dachongensis TaxID=3299029 RepID=A0ABW7EKQ5_9BURK